MNETEIQIFKHPQFGKIRTAGTSEEPLFCLVDLCKALEIKNPSRAKASLKEGGIHLMKVTTRQKNQYGESQTEHKVNFTFISEHNLYRLIMRSDKPQAEPFQDWVCGVVLPEIRKHGGYMVAKTDESDEVILARALKIMEITLKRRDEEIAKLTPKADYCDSVLTSVSCLTTTQVAKELGMTAIELNRLLCKSHIQYGQSGQYMLYADYARKGYAKNRTHCYHDVFGEPRTRSYLVWTECGRKFLHEFVTCEHTTQTTNV